MARSAKPYDALIVGAGHNGLVCACYLAAGGLRVCVVERRAVVGGAAVTEEFHPGFRNSTASYTVSLLNPKVIRDLRLAEHGLRIVERPFANFLPLPDGGFIKVGGGLEATQREIARFSKRDAERLPAYYARLEGVADVLRDLLLETPPNVGGGLAELFSAWKAGKRLNACRSPRSATCSTSSRCPRPIGSIAGSSPIPSRRASVSTAWSAISRARIRRAPPTCCCITCSAR